MKTYSARIVKNRLGCASYDELKHMIEEHFLFIPSPLNQNAEIKDWLFDAAQFDEWDHNSIKCFEEIITSFFERR